MLAMRVSVFGQQVAVRAAPSAVVLRNFCTADHLVKQKEQAGAAAAATRLSASIREAKETIYNVQGDYLDDVNLWQDAQDQYQNVMDAYAQLQGSLGTSAASFDAQVKDLSAAYAQLSVPPQRQHIKST